MPRRKRWGTPVGRFDAAFANLQTLEYNTIKTMVTPEFSVDQLLLAMYGEHVVTTLRAAFPIIQDRDRSPWVSEMVVVPTPLSSVDTVGLTRARLIVEARKARMCVPEEGTMISTLRDFEPLFAFLTAVWDQHQRFEKVGNVIRWLNKFATPGAAMNYCPWIKNLLPSDHEVHTLRGGSYRELTVPVGPLLNDMRECTDIVAAALFVGDRGRHGDDMLRLTFHGARKDWDTGVLTNYTSQHISFELA